MDLKEIEGLEDHIDEHWYFKSKLAALHSYLVPIKLKNVLDVGAGSGFFTKKLVSSGGADKGCCVDPNYTDDMIKENASKHVEFVKNIQETRDKHDIALFMDVLEHVADDVGLLKEYKVHLKDQGYVLITVPAFQFMWSGHDVYLEHYRRYTIRSLRKSVEESGLEVVKINYFFGSLFPLIAFLRLLNKVRAKYTNADPKSALKKHHPFVNAMLEMIHSLERKTVFRYNRLFGLSVFCLARKK